MKKAIALYVLSLMGCTSRALPSGSLDAVERDTVITGSLSAAGKKAISVPGNEGTARTIDRVVENGSLVAGGDVIAVFSQAENLSEVTAAEAGLSKIELVGKDKAAELDDRQGVLRVAIAKAEGELKVAERYSTATPYAIARNEILDAVQDVGYLRTRLAVTRWQLNQHGSRERAEAAVLNEQKLTLYRSLVTAQASLKAAEIRADYNGVVVLVPDWNGQLPHVGSVVFAGNPFAYQATSASMIATFRAIRADWDSISVGDPIAISMIGQTGQPVVLRVTSKNDKDQQRGPGEDVPYYNIQVEVPAQVASEQHWRLGGGMVGVLRASKTVAKH